MTRFLILVLSLMTLHLSYAVEGRYIRYGNPLSSYLGIAELEVWSGGENVLYRQQDALVQDYLFESYRGGMWELVDGKKDPEGRHVELKGGGTSTYSDTADSYPAIEADLGEMMPIDRIDIYRSRYTMKGFKDGGWRYLVVLDAERRIVAWEVFNVYQAPHPKNEGIWSFAPQAAEGAPAGRVVPPRNRSWLSEAEFIRDFLGKPVVDQVEVLSQADRARLQRFEQRNEPDELASLGERFFRLVELDRPGLEQVKALVEEERYAEALAAFKAPFLRSISELAEGEAFEYAWGYDPDSRATMRVRDLSNQIYGDKNTLTVTRFKPGLMPPAKFEYPFQMRPLLVAYSGTGDLQLLRRWEAMTDDWAMSFQDAADRNPALREHFVLIGGEITRNLKDLAQAAKDRPDFVEELSGATLARFLMPILEEAPVAMWRVWRKAVFNHTFNATGGGYEVAKLLADFRAGTRLEREMRQQTLRLHTLSQYRDGPMVEVGDEGHFVFNFLTPSRIYGDLCIEQPEWFTPAREAYMLDALREAVLLAVRHTSPSGVGSRWAWRRESYFPTLVGDRFNAELKTLQAGEPVPLDELCSFLQRAAVMHEPDVQAVADAVYGFGVLSDRLEADERRALRELDDVAARYHPAPPFVSDWLPYTGLWYFRGGWQREDPLLHMIKPTNPNNLDGGGNLGITKTWERLGPTAFRFQDYATLLLSTFATQIDKQMPAPHLGRYPSGSKQDVFTQASEKPQNARWYSDESLDFGEAIFEGAYHNIYRSGRDVDGKWVTEYEHDPLTIRDVTTSRQIIQVRPAGLFLQVERVAYGDGKATHTNRIPATYVLTEPAPETEKAFSEEQLQIDAEAKIIKARNPGNPGVTMAWIGQPELSFLPYTVQQKETMFWPQPVDEEIDPEKDAILNADPWGNGFESLHGKRRTSARGVMTSWPAQGESVLIGVLYGNAPGEEPVRKIEDISSEHLAAVRVTSANGVVTTLQVARQLPATLSSDDLTLTGEALLTVQIPKQPTKVMVLGATDGEQADYVMSGEDRVPILRPLDPPTVGPEVNVFTDRTTVTLSTTSRDAEIRYTTEVPASRLAEFREEARKLLAGETTLPKAAGRLALREPEGVDWQVYTGPFEISEDTLVRARTVRRGVKQFPMLEANGTQVSDISYGFFHQRELQPEVGRLFQRTEPGLRYEYLEDRWFALWTYTDVLPAKATGTTQELLDVSMRETDGPFGVRYEGYLEIPEDGVYTFYGPHEFVNNESEPGYDLRVYVDGEQWDLGQTWHGRGQWSIALEAGLHRFKVTYADARAKDLQSQRVDLWRHYPYPETTWKGTAPVLEISGPGLNRQPVPNDWLKH